MNIDNVEETKLDDDDYDSLTNKISDLEMQNETLSTPEQLNLNTGINSDLLSKMAEKLKTMPRNQILKLIQDLGNANKLPDHDFSTFTESSVKSSREKLQEKISALKAKRTNTVQKNNSEQIKSNSEQIKSNSAEQIKSISEEKTTIDIKNDINSEPEKKPLTKTQKRKLKRKNKLVTQTSDDSDKI